MTKSIKSAIVIGATGLVGKALIELLQQNPNCEKITAIVRRESADFKHLNKVEQFVLEDFLLLNDEDVSGYSHAFSCLGTTLKKAGSKQGFYAVDYTINAHFAELLQAKGTHYILVSALGAEAKSAVFYNRVKGELEQYIESLDLDKVSILRPSLLLGERNEQRRLEDLGQKLYLKISRFIPDHFTYKPVSATQVAHTMVEAAQSQIHKFQIYDNLQIQKTK